MSGPIIKVASPSFSLNPVLCAELRAQFSGVVFNESGRPLSGPALAGFLADADGAVIGLEAVTASLLEACPNLRVVAKYGVGLDTIDLEACRRRSVAVGWTGGVNRLSVAELTLCFMLGLCRNVFRTSTLLRGGTWEKNGGRQLSGRTVGILGFGHIGRLVASLLKPLGCEILVNDIRAIEDECRAAGLEAVDKDSLYARSDLITLHVPLTDLTRHLIDARALSKMQATAMLINTARGEVVDQAALKHALIQGVIAGAAIDVFESEPPTDLELLGLPNLVATPHIGGNALEAILAMGRSAISHLELCFRDQSALNGTGL